MPVDPAISLQGMGAAQAPINPMDTVGKFMQFQNASNQNKLFQQTMRSRLAWGPIFQEATDPATGHIDFDKAMSLGGQNPDTAFTMPEMAGTIAQRNLTLTELAAKRQEMTLKGGHDMFMGVFSGATSPESLPGRMSAVAKLLDPSIQRQVLGAGQDMIKSIMAPSLQADGTMKAPDDKEYSKRVASIGSMLGATQDEIHQVLGVQPFKQDVGSGTVMGGQDPNTGVPVGPTAMITQGTGPSQGMEPVGPGGASVLVNKPGIPGGQVLPSGAPAGTSSDQIANALMQPGGSSTPPQDSRGINPLTLGQPGGPTIVPGVQSLTPQQHKIQEEQGKSASDYITNLNDRVSAGGDMLYRLQEMRPLLEKTRAGGFADVRADLAKFAQGTEGIIPGVDQKLVDKIAGGDLAAAQEFQKFSVQYATEQLKQIMSGAVGKLTNLEFGVFQKNNPNLSTDPRAIEKIFNFATRVYQRDKLEQDSLQEARGKPGFDATAWPNQWQNIMQEKGIIKPEQVTGKALGTEPAAAPPTPASLKGKLGLHYSPNLKQYKDSEGKIYDSSGNLVK